MIYVVLKGGTYKDEITTHEFETEKEALSFLGGRAKSRIAGVFNGKRLDVEIGTRRVTTKGVTGFKEYEETEEGR